MGKKGSWFSAIKRVFTPNSKEKPVNDSEKKSLKEKKKKGKLKHGESNSFIPLFREPSSIEKIFGDFEREQHRPTFRPPQSPEQTPKTSSFAAPPAVTPRPSSPRPASPKAPSPRVASPRAPSPRTRSPRIVHHHHKEISYRLEPTSQHHYASAIRIQAAYRGYTARRSFRALKGLVRLQGVVRGQNVKRQTANAMKYMQLLVRVQSQIQSRRIQMSETQARNKNDKESDASFGKWNSGSASEAGNGDWDDSVLTKEEVEVRMQKKVEALVKRERSMAYAYSHKLWRGSPRSGQTAPTDVRNGGFPWWCNWLERQLPPPAETPDRTRTPKTFQLTPPRPNSQAKPSPRSPSNRHVATPLDTPTPRSSKSTAFHPPRAGRSPLSSYARSRADSAFEFPAKDDQSLTSCPPFSVPSYMAPTVSANAKVRAYSNPRERFPASPTTADSKRRASFPFSPSIFSNNSNAATPRRTFEKRQSVHSVDNQSVDSAVSMPATVGRKPFNRFV